MSLSWYFPVSLLIIMQLSRLFEYIGSVSSVLFVASSAHLFSLVVISCCCVLAARFSLVEK